MCHPLRPLLSAPVLALMLWGQLLDAQWPTANLYHFRMGTDGLEKPLMLTGFHANGYNNQPCFLSEKELLFTSDHLSPGMPDLWLIDLQTASLKRISQTAHQEFSPGIRPGTGEISAVRIEPDGKGTQRFWIFDPAMPGPGEPLPSSLRGVGYYTWKNRDTAAFFLIGQPQLLVMADMNTGRSDTIARNPGRCLRFDDAGRLLFVHKVTAEDWFLKYYLPWSGEMGIISRTPQKSEDFCLLPDGHILMASGSVIHRYHHEKGSWEPFADLSGYGLQHLTRLATFDGTQLIVVNQLP